jgi:hypothetical protein
LIILGHGPRLISSAHAALSEPAVVAKVLSHLDLPTVLRSPAPARAPPWSEDELGQGELDLDDDLEWGGDADLECADATS